MNKQKKQEEVADINLDELEKTAKADTDSIASLVLNVRRSEIIDDLPQWMRDYVVPNGTEPSTLNPFKCYARLVKIQREQGITIHPANQIDMLLMNYNVTVSKDAVSYKTEKTVSDVDEIKDVTVHTVCGYLLPNVQDIQRLCHASTADLYVTDAKINKAKEIVVPEWPKQYGVPVSLAAKYRKYSGSTKPGRTIPREEIFSYLSRPANSLIGLRVHTMIGEKLNNFSGIQGLDEQVKRAYKQKKAQVPNNFSIKVIGIQDGSLPYTTNIEDAYKMYFKSVSIRGGREGNNVAHGFERFSMTRINASLLNLVCDFKKMCERYKTDTIITKSRNLSNDEMRVLVANGISIVCPSMPMEPQVKGVPGVYRTTHADVQAAEYFKIEDDWVKPELVSKKVGEGVIKFGPYYDNAVQLISRRKRCFGYIYLDSRLKTFEKELYLLPSCTADTLKVIIATNVKESVPIETLVQRATQAISCRNRYVHYRKPFCSVDIMGKLVGWDTKVVIPKLKTKEDKKIVEVELFSKCELGEVEAPKIDIAELSNVLDQIVPEPVLGVRLLQRAYEEDNRLLFDIMVGLSQGQYNKYCDPPKEWLNKYLTLMDISEEKLIDLLGDIDANYPGEYEAHKAEFDIEEIPLEPNNDGNDAPKVPDQPQTEIDGEFQIFVDPGKRIKN